MRLVALALLLSCGAQQASPVVVLPPVPSATTTASFVAPVPAAPSLADAHAIEVDFENRVHLVGYRFDPEVAPPGTAVTITLFWRCDATVDDGWQLFTHITDQVTGKVLSIDAMGRQRPDGWEPGKLYVDEQHYTVAADETAAELLVYAGLWKEESRLRVIVGPNDGDNRAIVGRIRTGLPR